MLHTQPTYICRYYVIISMYVCKHTWHPKSHKACRPISRTAGNISKSHPPRPSPAHPAYGCRRHVNPKAVPAPLSSGDMHLEKQRTRLFGPCSSSPQALPPRSLGKRATNTRWLRLNRRAAPLSSWLIERVYERVAAWRAAAWRRWLVFSPQLC